jgi:hypothetical protein
LFKSAYININEHGIDLLSNTSVKSHIDFSEIKSITFYKGSLLNNWLIILSIGIAISVVSGLWIYYSLENWNYSNLSSASRTKILFLVSPWIILISGVLLFFTSLRKSIKIKINTDHRIYSVSIKEFEKQGKLNKLILFLESRINVKLEIRTTP